MSANTAVAALRKAERRARGLAWTAWIRGFGGTVGPGLEVERGATVRWAPHSGLHIGAGVRLGRGVVLDVPEPGRLTLGDRVKVMHYSVLAAAQDVQIGADCQIAEHCSIRDADHGTDLSHPFADQQVTTPVRIGDGVWVARGVAVLRGSVIGYQSVIGANSVVRGSIQDRSIAVGAPARVVRDLTVPR